MTDKERQDIALFRYGILAPLIADTREDAESMRGFFRNASERTYQAPDGLDVKIAGATMEKWYYNYKRGGFDALLPKRRVDIGKSRKLDDDIKAQIKFLKEEYPRIPSTLIHQKLIENGTIKPKEVSLSTITRYVNKLMIDKKFTNNKDMRRYEREHINEVWQGDSTVGLYLQIGGKKRRTYIQAILDDCSRYIVGVDAFFNDNFINLMSVMKSAVSRYGKPGLFRFDNGTPYKNKQMEMLVARLGSTISYCMPYTPVGKAKIERWFNTLKNQWMSNLNVSDFNSLDEFRESLLKYVDAYNKKPHSSLDGLSPEERFFNESFRIKRIPPETINTSFMLELERRVSSDSVVVLYDKLYEVDYKFAKQRITLRHLPDMKEVYLVDKATGALEPIKLLNKHENSHVMREKIRFVEGGKS